MSVERKSFLNFVLLDGTANGAIKCFTKAKDGIVYRIKRSDIQKYSSVDELKQCGIYLLIGKKNGRDAIYIGQANARKNGNGVLGRVLEHRRDSESYWEDAFILISSSNTIGATELNYLENQFCKMANDAGTYYVVNASDPSTGNYSEETEITMSALIEYVEMVMKVQRFAPFEKSSNFEEKELQVSDKKMETYYIRRKDNGKGIPVNACIEYDGEKFILKEGSVISVIESHSCHNSTKKKRTENKKHIDEYGTVTSNIVFDTPSAVAKFVTLSAVNGNVELKDENNVTFATAHLQKQ